MATCLPPIPGFPTPDTNPDTGIESESKELDEDSLSIGNKLDEKLAQNIESLAPKGYVIVEDRDKTGRQILRRWLHKPNHEIIEVRMHWQEHNP